jgi:hypothetical protein
MIGLTYYKEQDTTQVVLNNFQDEDEESVTQPSNNTNEQDSTEATSAPNPSTGSLSISPMKPKALDSHQGSDT